MVRRPKYLWMWSCLCGNFPICSLFITSPFSDWRLQFQIWGLEWIPFFLAFLIQDSCSNVLRGKKEQSDCQWANFLYLAPNQKISSPFESDTSELCFPYTTVEGVQGTWPRVQEWSDIPVRGCCLPFLHGGHEWCWGHLLTNANVTCSCLVFETRCSCLHFDAFRLQFYVPKFIMHNTNFSWPEAVFHTSI